MKKALLFFMGIMLVTSPICAQELTQNRKVATFAPGVVGAVGAQGAKKAVQRQMPKYARTTILRFEPGQVELSEIQKELLLRIANRIKEGQKITAVLASTEFDDARRRASAIDRFLESYAPQYLYIVRFIKPENVVPSVNNTAKIIENR